ncbi:MAG: hypothetical protein KDA78_09480 [Planctomycetaceae bacterium]|nr:hypothetical protein [Planctomycetaceae bacterium]
MQIRIWTFCLISLLAAGCVHPWNTQLPTAYSGDPRFENRRYEQFDPFAATELGPDTYSRPRGYTEARDRTRVSRDSRLYQNPGAAVPGGPMYAPQPPAQYPGVVPF